MLPLTNFTLAYIYQKLFSTLMHNWFIVIYIYICRKNTDQSAVIRSIFTMCRSQIRFNSQQYNPLLNRGSQSKVLVELSTYTEWNLCGHTINVKTRTTLFMKIIVIQAPNFSHIFNNPDHSVYVCVYMCVCVGEGCERVSECVWCV